MRIDIEKTRQYYKSLKQEELCDCTYCKNYCLQVKTEYPEVAAYLDSLGIDIENPFETGTMEPDENGMLEYCFCQYVVFGNCPTAYSHKINDVTFCIATSHPSTGIEEKHFVIEFYPIKLKMANYLSIRT